MSHNLFIGLNIFNIVANLIFAPFNLHNYFKHGGPVFMLIFLIQALMVVVAIFNLNGAFGPTP